MQAAADPATAAVLVLFGPAPGWRERAERLRSIVGHVLVIDNDPAARPAGEPLPAGIEWLHHGNRGALAGAYNAALALLAQRAEPPAHVVFCDQDSEVGALGRFLADDEVRAVLGRADTAAVSPAYCERRTGLRARYIELGRWRFHHLPRRFEGMRRVAFVINSMTVWRADALARLGPFDERLGIDHIDTDMCLRARAQGLGLFVHGGHEFAHSIGERRCFRLFGREFQATGHGPARRRLIGRNTMRLARRWAWREPAFAALCASRLAYEALGIVVAEDGRWAKLAALLGGAAQGLLPQRAG